MAVKLKHYKEIYPGANVIAEEAEQPHTGSWRIGLKPSVNLSQCVDCLLCWINCPDTAILLEDESFLGFDYDYCKGCELCAEVCPTNAIEMVKEAVELPPLGRIEKGGSHGTTN